MIRTKRPPGVRLALAESKADEPSFNKRRARAWWRCSRVDTHIAQRGAEEIVYPTHQGWQKDLARTVGYDGKIEDFKPRDVPIVLRGPDPMSWLDLHLSCWSAKCVGRHILSDAYHLKNDDFLSEPAQAEALQAQGIDPSDKERPDTWIGTAARRNEAGSDKLICCDPLTCEFFGNPDKTKCCLPVVDFGFTVTWAQNQTRGSFHSRAWGSMAFLKSSVEDLQDLLQPYNCTLSGVPVILTVDPRAVSWAPGETGTQPAASFALQGTLDELAERAERLLSLGAINADAQQKALNEAPPTLREIRETRAGRLGTSSEFTPEAYDAQMTAENSFRQRYSQRLSETVIDDLLHRFDADLDGAETAAEAMLTKPDAPEEEPIDAEFEADDDEGEIQVVLERYREAASDVPKDVQQQWFTEVGATWGRRPTLGQAKALVQKAQGGKP